MSACLVYYASFKLRDDETQDFPNLSVIGKNKSFALGPEVSRALGRGLMYGSMKVKNYQWETYARMATQGGEFTMLATCMVPPIKLPGTP